MIVNIVKPREGIRAAAGPVSYSIELVPQATSIKVELQGSGGIYYVDRVQVREADEEAGAYVSAKADVMQTNDYSPFGAPLANRNYKPIDEQNLQTLVSTTYDSGTDGWVSNGATLGNGAGRLQLLTYNAAAQSAQKTYTNLLTIGKKYRVSFDFIIDGITSASYTLSNGSTQVRNKVTTITTREVTEFTATATNLTLLATLSAGNYGRLAHIDNLVIEEIFEVGEGYRFGFNGMEKDNDTYGEGNAYDFGARIYDSRLGRWLSLDPLMKKYFELSPYNFCANNPILFIDPDGKRIVIPDPNQREAVLKMINSKARGLFGINDKGELYVVQTEGKPGFSEYYRDRLIEGINNPRTTEIIINTSKVKAPRLNSDGTLTKEKNAEIDIDKKGGGATFGEEKTDQLIYISPNENTKLKDEKGNTLVDKPADILVHEVVGHAIPKMTGKVAGNAVEEENKVREQYGKGKNQKRAAAPGHVKCLSCEAKKKAK